MFSDIALLWYTFGLEYRFCSKLIFFLMNHIKKCSGTGTLELMEWDTL